MGAANLKIHPEIEKFWIDRGWEIKYWEPKEITPHMMWNACWAAYKGVDGFSIAVSQTVGHNGVTRENVKINYHFDGLTYTEEQLLRLIKLKAFL